MEFRELHLRFVKLSSGLRGVIEHTTYSCLSFILYYPANNIRKRIVGRCEKRKQGFKIIILTNKRYFENSPLPSSEGLAAIFCVGLKKNTVSILKYLT